MLSMENRLIRPDPYGPYKSIADLGSYAFVVEMKSLCHNKNLRRDGASAMQKKIAQDNT